MYTPEQLTHLEHLNIAFSDKEFEHPREFGALLRSLVTRARVRRKRIAEALECDVSVLETWERNQKLPTVPEIQELTTQKIIPLIFDELKKAHKQRIVRETNEREEHPVANTRQDSGPPDGREYGPA